MEESTNKPKKNSLKFKAYLVLIALVLGAGIYGYFWYQKTNALRAEAKIVILKAKQFDGLHAAMQAEQDRCKDFIAQKEGDFGSFEYCKKFISWAEKQIAEYAK
jgi:uncharacterized protein HemX